MPTDTRTPFARDLRQSQTAAEAKLWQALRGGKLNGHKFRRQHPINRYYADFACKKPMLVIELDGAIHNEDPQDLKDQHRQHEIETLGWSILRFPNAAVMTRIQEVLKAVEDYAALARP